MSVEDDFEAWVATSAALAGKDEAGRDAALEARGIPIATWDAASLAWTMRLAEELARREQPLLEVYARVWARSTPVSETTADAVPALGASLPFRAAPRAKAPPPRVGAPAAPGETGETGEVRLDDVWRGELPFSGSR